MFRFNQKVLVKIYIVLLHVLILVMLVKSDFLLRVFKTLGGTIAPIEQFANIDIAHNRLRGIEQSAVGRRVYFLGDSNMNLMDVAGVSPKALQLSMGKDTARLMAHRITTYHKMSSAHAVVLAIGQNDLLFRSAIEASQDIENLFTLIPANVPVVLVALLPVDEFLAPKKKRNGDILEINKTLYTLCVAKAPKCQFSNSTANLVDSNGNLKSSFHVGDGVHLSPTGATLWANDIRQALNYIQSP